MMKTWNLALVIIRFIFTIFGTFMTRSGVVESVHAFGKDNVLALQFVLFMVLVPVVSFGLLVYRANKLAASRRSSRSPRASSRSCSTTGSARVRRFVLFATMFPTFGGVRRPRVAVGPDFFNKWHDAARPVASVPRRIAPLLAWRKTTRERLWKPSSCSRSGSPP